MKLNLNLKRAIAFSIISVFAMSVVYAQNMNRYITLTVQTGNFIQMDLTADEENTSIKIVSGDFDTTFVVGTVWTGFHNYTLAADTMVIYGNIAKLDCSENLTTDIIALDASHNVNLKHLICSTNKITNLNVSENSHLKFLDCMNNQLMTLDVSNCTSLTNLDCYYNQLSDLNLSQNTALKELWCYNNQLSDLNVSNNINLTYLVCYNNPITSLDVSNNLALTNLSCGWSELNSIDVSSNVNLVNFYCQGNHLSNLDVTANTALKSLWCSHNLLHYIDISQNTNLTNFQFFDNNFGTEAVDKVYCDLPDYSESGQSGIIFPLYNTQDNNHNQILFANNQNAIDKNWEVKYHKNQVDLPTSTSNYNCANDIKNSSALKNLTIYPNPVKDILHIETEETNFSVELYNMQGSLILKTQNSQNISVSHLSEGIYWIKLTTEKGIYSSKIVKT